VSDLRANWQRMLAAKPMRNRAAKPSADCSDGRVLSIPRQRPRYLVPPLSWVFQPRTETVVELDALGCEVLALCDDHRTVEAIIDAFATRHRLTFHESRVSVTNYIRSLVQRGVLVILDEEQEAES
jgi:hypothetical protein